MNGGVVRMRPLLAGCCLLLSPVLVACGADQQAGGYSPRAAQQLRADVARVRDAAEDRRRRATRVALHLLTRHVAAAQARGELPSAKARQILQAADLVAEDISALPAATDTSDPRPNRPERTRPEAGHGSARPGPQNRDGSDRHRHRPRGSTHRKADGAEKPEGWEAHKRDGGEKPEGWEAHKGDEDDDGDD